MNTNSLQSIVKPASLSDIVIAWAVVLLVSDLPDAMWQAFAGAIPTWLFWVKVGGLFAIIMLGFVWKQLYSLRPFFILLLILAAGRKALNCLGMTPSYVQLGEQAGLLLRMVLFEGSRLLLTAVMVAALLVMGKRRQDFFLVKGDLTLFSGQSVQSLDSGERPTTRWRTPIGASRCLSGVLIPVEPASLSAN